MKKNTTKNLTWKLSELPTAGELADLVDSEVITKEEAREIMFGSPENDKAKIESLEALVDWLQGLVKELSKNKGTTLVPYTQTVYIDRTARPYWDRYWAKTNTVLCQSGLAVGSNSNTTLTTTGGLVSGRSLNIAKFSGSTVGSGTASYSVNAGSVTTTTSTNPNAITLSVKQNTDLAN